ncbi:unnamed protein product [Musa textilis]
MREARGLYAGAGEEGQVDGDGRVQAVGGGPDGIAWTASLRSAADEPGVDRDALWAGGRGLRVGETVVRRAGMGASGEWRVASFHLPFRNSKGQEGVVVPHYLPGTTMDKFAMELQRLIEEAPPL